MHSKTPAYEYHAITGKVLGLCIGLTNAVRQSFMISPCWYKLLNIFSNICVIFAGRCLTISYGILSNPGEVLF